MGVGLHLEPNVASLLPDRGEAAALRRYVRGFGGGDLGVVMVKGDDADENAARRRRDRRGAPARAVGQASRPIAHRSPARRSIPMLLWRHADARAARALAAALTPEGMRARLRETRRSCSRPGAARSPSVVAQDPLRLAQLAFERRRASARGHDAPQADGAFANDDGTMHLVLVQARGAVAPRRRRQGLRRRRRAR